MRILILFLTLMATPLAAQKTVDCYCTDSVGNRVELGEMRCLSVGGRTFMAQCQMSLNNPMWRDVEQSCLTG